MFHTFEESRFAFMIGHLNIHHTTEVKQQFTLACCESCRPAKDHLNWIKI